jgi:hypothetical protein
MNRFKYTPIAVALTLAAGSALAASPAAQLPATEHQAEALVPDALSVKQKAPVQPDTQQGMPVTAHQQDVLKRFDKADTNRDGMLSRNEYRVHMESAAAHHYNKGLHVPETHGADSSGPRDRTEADNRGNPVR